MDKRLLLRRWRAAAISVLIGACASVAMGAEQSYGRGPITLTFHNSPVDRSKSEGFYVVKDRGLVRWQNFKERDEDDGTGPKKVYLITENNPIARTPANTTDARTARR